MLVSFEARVKADIGAKSEAWLKDRITQVRADTVGDMLTRLSAHKESFMAQAEQSLAAESARLKASVEGQIQTAIVDGFTRFKQTELIPIAKQYAEG